MAYGSSSPPPKMKPKMKAKPMMKAKPKMTDADKLKEHKIHHTPAHMRMMRKLMKEGMSFSQAHKKAMKEVGK